MISLLKNKTMKIILLFYFLLFSYISWSQNTIDEAIEKYNTGSIDYIDVKTLKDKLDKGKDLILLDTRAQVEYDISHLKNAVWLGYEYLNLKGLEDIDKNQQLIVYCSIGVRSEQIGEQLKAMGYDNIKNLYGGIFEWSNQGYPVYQDQQQTQKVHAYNKFWEKFLLKAEKVF